MLREEIDQAIQVAVTRSIQTQAYRAYLSDASKAMADALCMQFVQAECLPASSGTAALEIALRGLGLSEGDEILLSGYDYPGNFWAIERAGGFPVIVDTEMDSWNMSIESIERTLEKPNRCRALVASHLHGAIQDMLALRALCDRHNLFLIEDCCQLWGKGIGAKADAVIVSFGGGKIISAGRGGALLTRDESFAQKSRIASGAGSGPYAMSEVQCAIVNAQLPFLPRIIGETSAFFSSVAEELERLQSEIGQKVGAINQVGAINRPTGINSVDFAAQQYGFYQIGWLRKTKPASEAPSASAVVGHGFPGFHRRSARRCRTPAPLSNAPAVANRTVVLHHRIALEGTLAPVDVAKAMLGEQ
ncbi:MAG: aminotransferase class V-fold PLP-dependent enzyme [Aureliella sp.]